MIFASRININALLLTFVGLFCSPSLAATLYANCNEEAHVCLIAQTRQLHAGATNPAQKDEAIGGDLSEAGEKEYSEQIIKWLDTLPRQKQGKAREILSEAHWELQSLRREIYKKKTELAAVRFENHSSLERLPKLGMDLQKLRHTLRKKLEVINDRLLKEAGIKMNELAGEGLWLQPLSKHPNNKPMMQSLKGFSGDPDSILNDFSL